jgi:hypothetical protein
VVDGLVSEERLNELLALQGEYPDLDYKRKLDVRVTKDLVELASHVGAMRVRGGYIVVGADNRGRLTGQMDAVDLRPFDSANLVPKLLKYIAQPLEVHTGIITRDGHRVVVICVPRRTRPTTTSCSPTRRPAVRTIARSSANASRRPCSPAEPDRSSWWSAGAAGGRNER